MNPPSFSGSIRVGDGVQGRGVFALQAMAAQRLIESCAVILVPAAEIPGGVLSHYVFCWQGGEHPTVAIPTGLGLLYNHDPNPNATYRLNRDNLTIDFFTLRNVEPGEEILINYLYTPVHLDLIENPTWYDSLEKRDRSNQIR